MDRRSALGRLGPIVAAAEERSRRFDPLSEPRPAGNGERFRAALARGGLSLIAEIKRRSPATGRLSSTPDVLERACAYARGGARALSVLTEAPHFEGCPGDLERVRGAGLPRLRKDFLVSEACVAESRHLGADAVLLIARLFDPASWPSAWPRRMPSTC